MNTQLLQQAKNLNINEQIELVEAIWDNIASHDATPPLTESQRAELGRRLEDYLANPNDVLSWQEVKTAAIQELKSC
ncbi:MAG: addiction module protein [Methylovulum sp.]|uniref:addiction module protein n=1 Tax=Methylovulum sp. TaxID=1916980 RepID=UPI00262D4563|nr:addiction module protein [Methylovulum sp.]MDD2725349.1 addiction module protein [Methylovulum sp.]MDD5124444.1 addiction module protein [Methylovulum sp.]